MQQQIGVLGAGAFGTALAITQGLAGHAVVLQGRDAEAMAAMAAAGENSRHLPGVAFPPSLTVTADIATACAAPILLLAVPTQALRDLLTRHGALMAGRMLVLCCKGVERGTGLLPSQVVESLLPGARTAVLSGPSFAADIARGKPTALTLATTDPGAEALQQALSTPALRLYLSDDPVGAQLGGALKNVIAIAAGITIGAGLGDSARAALVTRGFAEIIRHATARGARAETLFGLSGFGDLLLTCSSAGSRNYSHGLAIGAGSPTAPGTTVEGVMTARAVSEAAADEDLPLTHTVAALLAGDLDLDEAVRRLMSRPQRREA